MTRFTPHRHIIYSVPLQPTKRFSGNTVWSPNTDHDVRYNFNFDSWERENLRVLRHLTPNRTKLLELFTRKWSDVNSKVYRLKLSFPTNFLNCYFPPPTRINYGLLFTLIPFKKNSNHKSSQGDLRPRFPSEHSLSSYLLIPPVRFFWKIFLWTLYYKIIPSLFTIFFFLVSFC